MWSSAPLADAPEEPPAILVRVRQGRNVGSLGSLEEPVVVRLALGGKTHTSAPKRIAADADFAWPDAFRFPLNHPPRAAVPPPQVLKLQVLRAGRDPGDAGREAVIAQGSFVVMSAVSPAIDTWMPLTGTNQAPLPVCVRISIRTWHPQDGEATFYSSPRSSPSVTPEPSPTATLRSRRSGDSTNGGVPAHSPKAPAANPLPSRSPRHTSGPHSPTPTALQSNSPESPVSSGPLRGSSLRAIPREPLQHQPNQVSPLTESLQRYEAGRQRIALDPQLEQADTLDADRLCSSVSAVDAGDSPQPPPGAPPPPPPAPPGKMSPRCPLPRQRSSRLESPPPPYAGDIPTAASTASPTTPTTNPVGTPTASSASTPKSVSSPTAAAKAAATPASLPEPIPPSPSRAERHQSPPPPELSADVGALQAARSPGLECEYDLLALPPPDRQTRDQPNPVAKPPRSPGPMPTMTIEDIGSRLVTSPPPSSRSVSPTPRQFSARQRTSSLSAMDTHSGLTVETSVGRASRTGSLSTFSSLIGGTPLMSERGGSGIAGNGSWTKNSSSNNLTLRRTISQLIEGFDFQMSATDVNYDAWDLPARRGDSPKVVTRDESEAPEEVRRKVSFQPSSSSPRKKNSPRNLDYLAHAKSPTLRRPTTLDPQFYDAVRAQSDPRASLLELRGRLRQAELARDEAAQMNASIWCGTLTLLLRQRTEAMAAYRSAFELAQSLGDLPVQVQLLGAIGDLCRTQNDYSAALDSYSTALRQAEALQSPDAIGSLCGQLGQLHFLQGDYTTARNFFQRQLDVANSQESAELTALAQAGLGTALFGLGDLPHARHAMEIALDKARCLPAAQAERIRRHLPFWGYTFERLLLADGWATEALAIAEERRTALYLHSLIWRTQKEVSRMRVLGPMPLSATDDVLQMLLDAEYSYPTQEVQAIAEEAGVTFLIYSLDRDSSTVGRPTFLVWVVTPKGGLHCKHLALENLPLETEGWQDGVAVGSSGFPHLVRLPPAHVKAPVVLQSTRVATAQQLAQHLQAQLGQLYDTLIGPVERYLPGKEETLAIIPDGALWGVPWCGLWSSAHGYLVERYNVFCVPSVRTFTLLRLLKQIRSYLDSGTGYLVGPEMDVPLEQVGKEVPKLYVQNIMWPHSSRVEATEASVKSVLERCSLIHVEGHATGEYYSDWRQHRGALLLSSGEQLHAHDIAKLDLPAVLAVLSCQATYGRVIGEGVLDLPRTLLGSGACAVLGTYWPNHLPSTMPQVLLDFYLICGNKETDRAKALRQAMLRSLRTEHTKSPLLWARFYLCGVP